MLRQFAALPWLWQVVAVFGFSLVTLLALFVFGERFGFIGQHPPMTEEERAFQAQWLEARRARARGSDAA